jgi:hypothetical protein
MVFDGARGLGKDFLSLGRRHMTSSRVLDCRLDLIYRDTRLPQRSGRAWQVDGTEDVLTQRILRRPVVGHENRNDE